MGGHPLLRTIKEDRSIVTVGCSEFTIIISTHDVEDVSGEVLGIKFTNESGSMDSAIRQQGVDSWSIINALAIRADQMIAPRLSKVAMIGFYLLTDDLENRSEDAVRAKSRLYDMGAKKIHKKFKHELPIIDKLKLEGAFGWVMTKSDIKKTTIFNALQKEFTRQIEVL